MLKVRMDPGLLSTEELENISRALRGPCAACVEHDVPEGCRHPELIRQFLHGLADALDGERHRRQH